MEFWERNFIEKKEMWGDEAAQSTIFAVGFFLEHNIKNILIPGFGYGRNGRPFLENGIKITGCKVGGIVFIKKFCTPCCQRDLHN